MSQKTAIKIAAKMLQHGKGFSETANHISQVYGNENQIMPRAVEQYRTALRRK